MTPRILVIDDEESVQKLVLEALCPPEEVEKSKSQLLEMAGSLYESEGRNIAAEHPDYSVTLCSQGKQGVEEVKKSVEENRPYCLIFLDMRMPPGKDGLWTAQEIRKYDQMSTIMIMTAYTNIDPSEIASKIAPADKFLYVQKPLRPPEIRQFAAAFSEKWKSEQKLFNSSLELMAAREHLEVLLSLKKEELLDTGEKLGRTQKALEDKKSELKESNIAMKVLMKNIGSNHKDIEEREKELDEKVVINIKELTEPFLDKLGHTDLDDEQIELLTILRNNIDKATSSAMHRLYSSDANFTPSEVQVANLIKQGKTSKEISSLLNIAVKTVDFHRDNLRKKLGITNRKTSLKSVVQSL